VGISLYVGEDETPTVDTSLYEVLFNIGKGCGWVGVDLRVRENQEGIATRTHPQENSRSLTCSYRELFKKHPYTILFLDGQYSWLSFS
jgi:hypothetical protein